MAGPEHVPGTKSDSHKLLECELTFLFLFGVLGVSML